MARNVEIKAKVDDLASLRALAASLVDDPPVFLSQVDTYFNCEHGRLKLREFGDGSAELIAYRRPNSKQAKTSNYTLCPVSAPALLKETLSKALGVWVTVSKSREVFLHGKTRIHLDEVAELGTFIEFEDVLDEGEISSDEQITSERVESLRAFFGVSNEQLISGSYSDLIASGKS